MADRSFASDHNDDAYLPGNYDFGVLYNRVKTARPASWVDGLPHDFTGWGPQTPDPEKAMQASPALGLVWTGEGEAEHHHVWRFDMRRRSHH